MPRDLSELAKEATLNQMSELTKEQSITTDGQPPPQARQNPQLDLDGLRDVSDSDEYESDADDGPLGAILSQRNQKRDELHPYTQTLTMSDVESCVQLEEAAFPPHERCTREKFQYRLATFGELSMGIFTSSETSDDTSAVDPSHTPTTESSKPVYSGAPSRRAVLLGIICATRGQSATVTDKDMEVPSSPPDLGATQDGRTICIHSLATLPAYQGRGLGKTLMKAYLQRLEAQGVADRAALLAHDHLIPFYEKLGFTNKGQSACTFGGGGWYDMVKEFKAEGSPSPV